MEEYDEYYAEAAAELAIGGAVRKTAEEDDAVMEDADTVSAPL